MPQQQAPRHVRVGRPEWRFALGDEVVVRLAGRVTFTTFSDEETFGRELHAGCLPEPAVVARFCELGIAAVGN